MGKLKLGPIEDERPVKLVVELPATLHRDLVAYAALLAKESGQAADPAKLVGPMLARFMSSDRAFAKARRTTASKDTSAPNDARNPVTRREQGQRDDGKSQSSQSSEAEGFPRPRSPTTP